MAGNAAEEKRVALMPRAAMLLEAMRDIGYTFESAVADLVDNSLSAKAKNIWIDARWNSGDKYVAISDDGRAMNRSALLEAMRLGSADPTAARSADDLGRFGLGLKTASLSQCRRFTVVCKNAAGIHAVIWDVDEAKTLPPPHDWDVCVADCAKDSISPRLKKLIAKRLAGKSGTLVLWEKIDRPNADTMLKVGAEKVFNAQVSSLMDHLALTFHRFLNGESGHRKVALYVNNGLLEGFDPYNAGQLATKQPTPETLKIRHEDITVTPYVLPHPSKVSAEEYRKYEGPEGYLENAGFYIYRNRRLISKGTWYRLIRRSNLSKLLRIQVDVPSSLDYLWSIDVRKSQSEVPADIKKELQSFIKRWEQDAKVVYHHRGSKLIESTLDPVWSRIANDGTIRYEVNRQHPLIAALAAQGIKTMSQRSIQRRQFCTGVACATLTTILQAGNSETNKAKAGSATSMNKSIIGNFKFIDLFCGIGGFHQAMSDLGGKCVFACDIDSDCRKTYQRNYGLEPVGDITKVEAKDIPPHDVLCAGFPCQAFSKAGNRLGFADKTKGTLFFDVVRILKHHQPPYALLENVRNLASHDGGNTWRVIYESLNDVGYNVIPEPIIFSPHYVGIPQHRERVFIMCVRKDVGEIPAFYLDEENIPKCTIDSILLDDKDIPNLSDYQLSQDQIELINIWNEFIQNIKCKRLPGFPVWADCLKSMEELEIQWGGIDKLPAWEQSHIRKNSALWEQNKEFIAQWLPRAQKCKLFFGAKAKLEWQAGQYEHPNMWDHIMQIRPSGIRVKIGTYYPALVAITQTSIVGRRKRFLTPRECARLQSFPDAFLCDENERQAYKQFGNSVNVAVVRLFGQYLLGDQKIREKYSVKNKPLTLPTRTKTQAIVPSGATTNAVIEKRRGRPKKVFDDERQMRFF